MESIRGAIDFLGGPAAIWILATVYFGCIIGERLWYLARKRRYNSADAWCSVGLNLLSSVLNLIFSLLIPLALYVLIFDQFRLVEEMALWLAIPLAFLAHELAYYSDHRLIESGSCGRSTRSTTPQTSSTIRLRRAASC